MALLSVRQSSIRSPLITHQWPTAISYHLLLKTRPTTAIYDNQLRFTGIPGRHSPKVLQLIPAVKLQIFGYLADHAQ
jgi:hypothetical protein